MGLCRPHSSTEKPGKFPSHLRALSNRNTENTVSLAFSVATAHREGFLKPLLYLWLGIGPLAALVLC